MNDWAAARQAEGDTKGAILGFSGAVLAATHEFGKESPVVAIILNNLANVQREVGNYQQALEEYKMAAKIDYAAYGPMHPTVGDRTYRVGLAYEDLGETEKAREMYERAFAVLAQTRGIGGEDTMAVALALIRVGGDPVGFAQRAGAPEGVVNAIVAEIRRMAAERQG